MIDAEWFDEAQGIYHKPGGWYKTCKRATPADVARMYFRLWGRKEFAKSPWDISSPDFEDGAIFDLCEGLQINERK